MNKISLLSSVGQQQSTHNRKVTCSSQVVGTVKKNGDIAQFGRALALHVRGYQFKSDYLHNKIKCSFSSVVERNPYMVDVGSSSLSTSTIKNKIKKQNNVSYETHKNFIFFFAKAKE